MTYETDPNPTKAGTAAPEGGPIDVEAQPMEETRPGKRSGPPRRNISWLGWMAAIVLFFINKKLGIVMAILLLVFRQYPSLNLKRIARATGKFLKELRSS